MLRIHLTDGDLARVRVATDPLWETVLAVQQLHGRGAAAFSSWRRQAVPLIAGRGLRGAVDSLRVLAPAGAVYFPDFLTPAAGRGGMDAGTDALYSTSRRQLSDELSLAFHGRPAPLWVRELATGDRKGLERVTGAFRLVHRTLVAPGWTRAADAIEADRAVRTRALRDQGVHGLLASFHPLLRWNPPVLEMPYPESREVHLGGRGLCLVPSAFCATTPVALADPGMPQVVVYPVAHTAQGFDGAPHHDALAALLGWTRARVLAALEDGSTTGELARALRIAPSSASEHVTVLRNAGLAMSSRRADCVVHALTPLGGAVLRERTPPSARKPPG